MRGLRHFVCRKLPRARGRSDRVASSENPANFRVGADRGRGVEAACGDLGGQTGEIRARLAGKSPTFLSANFDDGDATIIVSVSVNDPACENLSGALGRATTGSDCPMRVARLSAGAVSILAASDHFVVPVSLDASGAWAPPSPNNSVVITFDPASHALAISERIDGEAADAVNPNPILLKY